MCFGSAQGIVYTAQNRIEARRKWEDDFVRVLKKSALSGEFNVRLQIGQEAIRWHNGSMHGLSAPTEKAAHGQTLDLAVIDEAFAREDSRVEQAMRPAMITRPEPQLWVVSTAGTDKSVYLRSKVNAGRARCEIGTTISGVAYFEWSAEADDDPSDVDTWVRCMPALGHTISLDAIKSDFEGMNLNEFRRAYLNQWPEDLPSGWLVISYDKWQKLLDAKSAAVNPVAFGVEVKPDRSSAVIVAASFNRDAKLHVEIVDQQKGVVWVPGRMQALVGRHKSLGVVVDPVGPAGALIEDLESLGIEITKMTLRDMVQACGQFYDAVESGNLRHRGQPILDTALGAIEKRKLGDGWAWERKNIRIDVSSVVAATIALWGFQLRVPYIRAKQDPGVWVF
jgi:hypothetical protein